MNARMEKKLQSLAVIVVVGTMAGLAVHFEQVRTSPSALVGGAAFGFITSVTLGGVELFVLGGMMRDWLGGLSFTANLMVRSAIYAALILVIQIFQSDEIIAGLSPNTLSQDFWTGVTYSALIAVLMNLIFGIANIIGPRAFLNVVTGRYHSPVEEDGFVLFVDIAGSTELAERARRHRHSPSA
jgi:adenylate cyclase